MSDFVSVATEFVTFYYQTFDSNRLGLGGLYGPNSMLTFEGQQFQGPADILEKLKNLPFQKVQHKITTLDAQPGINPNNIIISVTGLLLVDDETHPMPFSQTFFLVKDSSFYVHNDIFRLNLA